MSPHLNSLILTLFFILQGCVDPPSNQIEPYEVYDSSTLTTHTSDLSGTAKIRFTRPLFQTQSASHFHLSGRFVGQASQLTLISNFTGFDDDDGVVIEFIPQDHSMNVFISTPGYSKQVNGVIADSVAVDGTFDLHIEIHHFFDQPLGVFIWNNQILNHGSTFHKKATLNAASADLDTVGMGMTLRSYGRGNYWGISLDNAVIHTAKRG